MDQDFKKAMASLNNIVNMLPISDDEKQSLRCRGIAALMEVKAVHQQLIHYRSQNEKRLHH